MSRSIKTEWRNFRIVNNEAVMKSHMVVGDDDTYMYFPVYFTDNLGVVRCSMSRKKKKFMNKSRDD